MSNTARVTARNAERDGFNAPGMCLQVCRTWAGISAMYPDATTAWVNTNDRHPGSRTPPRGSAVYWTGGSSGHGHIAISLGGGNVRSTDAGGQGICATRSLGWFDVMWGNLFYAGWAWDINETTIRHIRPLPPEEVVKEEDICAIAQRVNKALGDFKANGSPRPGTGRDLGSGRMEQIENTVRRLERDTEVLDRKLDKIIKLLGTP